MHKVFALNDLKKKNLLRMLTITKVGVQEICDGAIGEI